MSYTDRIRRLIEEIKKRNKKLDGDFSIQVEIDNIEFESDEFDDSDDLSSYFVDPNNPFDDPDYFSIDDGGYEKDIDLDENIIDVSKNKPREINFDNVNITTADKLVEPVNKPSIEPSRTVFQFPFTKEKTSERFEMPKDEYTNSWSSVEKAFLDKQVRYSHDISEIPWPTNLSKEIYYDLAYALNKRLIARKSSLEKVGKKHTYSIMNIYSALYSCIIASLPQIYFKHITWLENRVLNELATIIGETEAKWVSKYIEGWIGFKGIEADPVTCEYYGYLKSGIPIVWWDKNGRLREEGILKDEVFYLENLSFRKSIFMECPELNERSIILFTKVCSIIINELKNPKVTWPPGTKARLKKLFPEDNIRIWVSDSAKYLLASLFKITENAVRVNLLDNKALNVDNEMDVLKYQLRPNVFEDIIKLLNSYEAPDLYLDEAISITRFNEKFCLILLLALKNTEEKDKYSTLFKLLNFIEDKEFKVKILNLLFDSDDITTSIISALSLNADGKLRGSKLKKAKESVHKTQLKSFEGMLENSKKPVLEDLDYIKGLQYLHRKDITLDPNKIDKSRIELSRVIENVKTIVGTDVDDDIEKKEESIVVIKENKLEDDASTNGTGSVISMMDEKMRAFIKKAVSDEGLLVKEAEEIADQLGIFLSSFIENINNVLYEKFEDQVLLIDGDYVIADEYYKEELLELMNGY